MVCSGRPPDGLSRGSRRLRADRAGALGGTRTGQDAQQVASWSSSERLSRALQGKAEHTHPPIPPCARRCFHRELCGSGLLSRSPPATGKCRNCSGAHRSARNPGPASLSCALNSEFHPTPFQTSGQEREAADHWLRGVTKCELPGLHSDTCVAFSKPRSRRDLTARGRAVCSLQSSLCTRHKAFFMIIQNFSERV